MGTWNNLQEGFTVNERLPDTLVDVAVWHVFNRAPQLYRQAPQIKKPPCVTLKCPIIVRQNHLTIVRYFF